MKNRKLKTTLDCLIQGRIVEAIQESSGWKNVNEDNIVYIIHCKIRNFFFDRAFHRLPDNYRYKLISKLNHKTHFTDGISKSYAIEYYYLSHDAYEEDWTIKGLEGGFVKMTKEMKAYYHAIDETVIEIADNKTLLKDLIYEVAKSISSIFYERLELVSKELSLSCDVKDDVYVAAPIPYKEYKFGNHATVKCFEPEIAFGMEIHGVRDSLKPINEYISEIKMFIDAYKKNFQNTTEKEILEFRTLDAQKTAMIEHLKSGKLITSKDFMNPYIQHFKYVPQGTSFMDGVVINGKFCAFNGNESIRQMNENDFAINKVIVYNDDNSYSQDSNHTLPGIVKTSAIERLMCIAMLDIDTKKLFNLGFYGQDIKQAIDYSAEYLRLNKTNSSIKVIVTDIKWDVDHDSDSENLPKEVLYTFDRNEFDCIDDELQNEIEDIVSEKLSDDYGYCHDGFSVTIK